MQWPLAAFVFWSALALSVALFVVGAAAWMRGVLVMAVVVRFSSVPEAR